LVENSKKFQYLTLFSKMNDFWRRFRAGLRVIGGCQVIPYSNTCRNSSGETLKLEENLIVSYSEKRAAKDRADRGRLIEKAKRLLDNPAAIKASSKRGGKRYLNDAGGAEPQWVLDIDKIESDSKFDGYYGIQTSEKEMSALRYIEWVRVLWYTGN
jgi:hypothetical protein